MDKFKSPPQSKILRARIGKIGFKTQRMIIDPVGLINPEITKFYLNDSSDKYFQIVKPDYVITNKLDENIFKNAKLEKSFPYKSNFLVRQLFFNAKVGKQDTLKIYKVFR